MAASAFANCGFFLSESEARDVMRLHGIGRSADSIANSLRRNGRRISVGDVRDCIAKSPTPDALKGDGK